MPTVTVPLSLIKPTVGGDKDVWGGYWNTNADLINAIHLDNGTGTSVGMHVGAGKVLKVDGTGQLDTQFFTLRDATDNTKAVSILADQVATATTRTLHAPNADGTILTQESFASQIATYVPVGTIAQGYYGATPPAGWVFADGRTIGDVASGATNRANDTDTLALFSRLWGFNDATRFPMYLANSTTLATRGATAAADFAAHRHIALPDHSGATMAGRDDLSGTSRNRLNVAFPGGTNVVRGAFNGTQTQIYAVTVTSVGGGISGSASGSLGVSGTVIQANVTGLAFGGGGQAVQINDPISGTASGSLTVSGSFSGSGGGVTDTRSVTQPTVIVDVIIKL